MGDFKKFGKKGDTWNRGAGGKPSFNSRPGFNRGGDERREMFKAVCAECSRPTEVPFRPSGERPVYCKECFQAMGPQERHDDRGGRDSRGPSNFQKRDFTPRPSSHTPAQGSGEDKRLDDLKIQLATAISKLDKLINILGNTAHTTPQTVQSKSETLRDTLVSAKAPVAATTVSAPASKKSAPKAAKKKSSPKKK